MLKQIFCLVSLSLSLSSHCLSLASATLPSSLSLFLFVSFLISSPLKKGDFLGRTYGNTTFQCLFYDPFNTFIISPYCLFVSPNMTSSVFASLDDIYCLLCFCAAAPKGSMTYAFTHMGNFLLLLLLLFRTRPPPSLQAHISASRSISQPRGPNPSLEVQIPTSRPKSHLTAKILSLRPKFQPQGIWASTLGFGPQG